MPVESPGSGESLVERLGKVRSSDDDDTFRLLKAVQLDQKLVERLLHVVLILAKTAARTREHTWSLAERFDPIASSSSMKTIAGAFFRAASNSSRTRLATG